MDLVKKWKGNSAETDWIIRHGCRTLLKKADANVYALFGLDGKTNCEVNNLKLSKNKIKIGERLGFSFALKNAGKKPSKLRLEYVKANGKQSRKIFKLAENNYQPNYQYSFKKEQRFEDFTTRKHFPGKHKIGIVVNGRELAVKEFIVLK